MKKALLNIAIIGLTFLFTTASGGMFFIFHHCRIHNHSVVTFFKEVKGDCCHTEYQHCSQACCQGSAVLCDGDRAHADPCCSERSVYLKLPYQFLQSDKKIVPPVHTFFIGLLEPVFSGEKRIMETGPSVRPVLVSGAWPDDLSIRFAQILV